MKKILVLLMLLILLIGVSGCKGSGEYLTTDATDVLSESFGIAIKKGDSEMMTAVNAVIDKWNKDGTLKLYHEYYYALSKGESVEAFSGLKKEWQFNEEGEVLEMYTEATFAPYEFIYNNQIVGIDVAIASEVATSLGLKLVIKDVKFDNVITNLNASLNKAIGAAGLTIDEERKKTCDFSNVYSTSALSIVTKGRAVDKLSKLNGMTVGVQQGTSGDLIISEANSDTGYTFTYINQDGTVESETIKIKCEILRYESYSAAISALKINKIDAIFMDKLPSLLLVDNANSNEKIGLYDKFYNAVIAEGRWLLYLEGLGNTLIIALIAVGIGVICGFLIATVNYLSKISGKFKILSKIFKAYVTIIRGTPVVLQLFIMYFIVLTSMRSDILIGAITFGLNSAAYVSEIARAGFESVDKGQMEAGRSLGLSAFSTTSKIIMPQAVKNSLPSLFNEFISLVKETAVVGYVGIMDLGKVPGLIQSRTFDYIFPLIISALLYLGVVCALTAVLHLIEKRLAKSEKRLGGGK